MDASAEVVSGISSDSTDTLSDEYVPDSCNAVQITYTSKQASGHHSDSNLCALSVDEQSRRGWLNTQPVTVNDRSGHGWLNTRDATQPLYDIRRSATFGGGLVCQSAGLQLAPVELQLVPPELDQSAVQGSATSGIGSLGQMDGPPVYSSEDSGDGLRIQEGGSYVTHPVISHMCSMQTRLQPRHDIGGIPSQMNMSAWDCNLTFEDDKDTRDYLHDGIQQGFPIVDADGMIQSYYCDNYDSAVTGDAFEFVDNLIESEILEGKYVPASQVPHCVHALGAIPKADGSYRPITDCRRPEGLSINNHMDSTFKTFNYITIDQVAANVKEGCFMASIDIFAAYRSISIKPDQWTYQGIMWPYQGQLMPLWDARLSFGLRCAPFIFTNISNFVAVTMERMGYKCVANYLDDFLVFGDTYLQCQTAQMALITLLGDLGFAVSWKKCSTPSTSVRYLGIIINSIDLTLSLPKDKLMKMKKELEFFVGRTRATKKQIQRLCGILAHSAKVIRGGRTFSRRMIDLLSGLKEGNPRI